MTDLCSRCHEGERAPSHGWCRACKRESDRQWYAKNAEARRDDMKARHRQDPRIHMISAAKKRAKEGGIAFDLTRDSITIPATCPVLGIEIRVNDRRWQDSSPTLDRLDPAGGYLVGNVIVISARANRIKNDATAAELDLIAAYIRRSQ
jgi:hypothetical protein